MHGSTVQVTSKHSYNILLYNSSTTRLWPASVSVVSTMGDTVFLGSQCEEIIVTTPLFVIDVYLASDSYTLGKPRLATWLKYSPYRVDIRNSSGSDLIDRSPTLQKT